MSIESGKRSIPSSTSQLFRETFGSSYSENHELKNFTRNIVNGVADRVVIVNSGEELIKAVELAYQEMIPYNVIGLGNGTLISDIGYSGLLIINRYSSVIFSNANQIIVGSGTPNNQVVNVTASRSLGGLEFLLAIPGSIGGAVATNATLDNISIGSFVKEATVLIPEGREMKLVNFKTEDFVFQPYASKILSLDEPRPVIITIKIQTAQLPQDEIFKRMVKIRSAMKSIDEVALGHIFRQPLKFEEIDRELVNKIQALGVKFAKNNPNRLLAIRGQIKTQILHQVIQAIREHFALLGKHLDLRLTLLGYWPDGEENGFNT